MCFEKRLCLQNSFTIRRPGKNKNKDITPSLGSHVDLGRFLLKMLQKIFSVISSSLHRMLSLLLWEAHSLFCFIPSSGATPAALLALPLSPENQLQIVYSICVFRSIGSPGFVSRVSAYHSRPGSWLVATSNRNHSDEVFEGSNNDLAWLQLWWR